MGFHPFAIMLSSPKHQLSLLVLNIAVALGQSANVIVRHQHIVFRHLIQASLD
jgi:hypothetical protein